MEGGLRAVLSKPLHPHAAPHSSQMHLHPRYLTGASPAFYVETETKAGGVCIHTITSQSRDEPGLEPLAPCAGTFLP